MSTKLEQSRNCPTCSHTAPVSRFDLAVRGGDDGERHFFGLLAALCRWCGRFLVDADEARLFRFDETDIASAIQSDRYLRMADGPDPA